MDSQFQHHEESRLGIKHLTGQIQRAGYIYAHNACRMIPDLKQFQNIWMVQFLEHFNLRHQHVSDAALWLGMAA